MPELYFITAPEQAREAIAQKPDYIGCGPVWATPTTDIPDPTLGVETAVAMVKSVPFPAVCIGGIDSGRLPELIRAGAVTLNYLPCLRYRCLI